MQKVELVIDIGSKFVTISQKGKGVVIKEPSLVLLESRRNKMQLVVSGKAVANYAANNSARQTIAPIKGGVVVHEYAAMLLFKDLLLRLVPYRFIFRPQIKVIACVSCGITNTEKNQIEKVLTMAGVSEVVILESPIAVCASIGDGSAQFVVDIGESKTEVAVVGKDGIVVGCAVNIGGNVFNQAIVDFVTDTKRCRLPYHLAEKTKKQVGSLYENDLTCTELDLQEIGTNRVFAYKIYAKDIKNAVEPLAQKIVEVIYNMSFQIPPELAEEIYTNGISLCGGSACLPGLAEYIGQVIEMDTHLLDDPTNVVAKGGLFYLDHPERLASVLNVDTLK
ncbi:MAG: rod shape-determining protein [Clostridia bacterium]